MAEDERLLELRERVADQERRIEEKVPLSKSCILNGPNGRIYKWDAATVTWFEAPLSFRLASGKRLGKLSEALPPSAEFSYSDRIDGGISVRDVIPDASFMKRSRSLTGLKSRLTPAEYEQELAGWERTRETTLDWAGFTKGKVIAGDGLVRLLALREGLEVQVGRDYERIARPLTALQRVLMACLAESEASSPTAVRLSRVIATASSFWLEVCSGTRPRFVRDILPDIETAMVDVGLPDGRVQAQVTGLNHFLDEYEVVWAHAARAEAQRIDCERVLDHVLQGGSHRREDLALLLREDPLYSDALMAQTTRLFMRALLESDGVGGVQPNTAFKGRTAADLHKELVRLYALDRPDQNPPLTPDAFNKRLKKLFGAKYPKAENISKSERMSLFLDLAFELHEQNKANGIDVDLVSERA